MAPYHGAVFQNQCSDCFLLSDKAALQNEPRHHSPVPQSQSSVPVQLWSLSRFLWHRSARLVSASGSFASNVILYNLNIPHPRRDRNPRERLKSVQHNLNIPERSCLCLSYKTNLLIYSR